MAAWGLNKLYAIRYVQELVLELNGVSVGVHLRPIPLKGRCSAFSLAERNQLSE